MSGRRPLLRSPKLADGMTSEAMEVSGVKVCMFAIGRGSGVARRFESVAGDANEPTDISKLKPGKRTAKVLIHKIHAHYSPVRPRAQSIIPAAPSILAECVRNAPPGAARAA